MLMLPNNRHIAAGHINNHLTTKPAIQKVIDTFSQAYFTQPIIGLHIRGQGRADGGAAGLRAQLPCESGVPFGQYFDLVRKELCTTPAARIFICSDSQNVIDRTQQEFGDKVFSYESSRSDFGEMHERRESPESEQFSGYKLGEDILVEAYLLAHTDVFIHGNSNVANFVLCKNPDLRAISAYEGIRPVLLRVAVRKLVHDYIHSVRHRFWLRSGEDP